MENYEDLLPYMLTGDREKHRENGDIEILLGPKLNLMVHNVHNDSIRTAQ
jgi:hypothetical protein